MTRRRSSSSPFEEPGEELTRAGWPAEIQGDGTVCGFHRQRELKEPATLAFCVNRASDLLEDASVGRKPKPAAVRTFLDFLRATHQLVQDIIPPRLEGGRAQGAGNRQVGHCSLSPTTPFWSSPPSRQRFPAGVADVTGVSRVVGKEREVLTISDAV